MPEGQCCRSPRHSRGGGRHEGTDQAPAFSNPRDSEPKVVALVPGDLVLLGSSGHSVTGIMQPRWEPKQVRQLIIGTLLFTPAQSGMMRVEAGARIERQRSSLMSISSTP